MNAADIKRYEKKSYQALEKLAVKYFNAFIRRRDQSQDSFVCISCQQAKPLKQMHAGHYMAAGTYPHLRFDEQNVNGQCNRCNRHIHGNLLRYREGLIQKIGLKAVEALEMKSKMRGNRPDRFTLIETITNYKKKETHEKVNHDLPNRNDPHSSRRMQWK